MEKKKYINVERKIQSEGYYSQDSFSFCNKTEAYNFIFKDFEQNQKELEAKGYFLLDVIRNQTKNVSVYAANFMNNESFHIIDIRWMLNEVEECEDTADVKKSEASTNEKNVSKEIYVEIPSGRLVAEVFDFENTLGIAVVLRREDGTETGIAYHEYVEESRELMTYVWEDDAKENHTVKHINKISRDKVEVNVTNPDGNKVTLNMNRSEIENKWMLVTFCETGDVDQIIFPKDEADCFRSAFAVVKSGNPAPAVIYNGVEKNKFVFEH